MFGYVTASGKTLEKAERERYQDAYCGLCLRLGDAYGSLGRMTLTYDMTFLSMLLGSLYQEPETASKQRCPVNPLKQCACVASAATDYAADINLLLGYYKCLDDWHDDKSRTALEKSKQLAAKLEPVRERWPRQCRATEEGLRRLGEMERANELNPDLPANCFGQIMGELFVWREDAWAQPLRTMGAALGRFIYLMDACMDLRADIKKERYNPLIASYETDFTPMLTMMIGECTSVFETLPITRDVRILRNILYAGVWTKYISRKEGQEKRHDGSV